MSYTNDLSGLKPYELQVLVDFFMYYMPMEQRGQLMRDFPGIYNKLIGKQIMLVVNSTHEEA